MQNAIMLHRLHRLQFGRGLNYEESRDDLVDVLAGVVVKLADRIDELEARPAATSPMPTDPEGSDTRSEAPRRRAKATR
jgi:hypothetical protein